MVKYFFVGKTKSGKTYEWDTKYKRPSSAIKMITSKEAKKDIKRLGIVRLGLISK
jgi:hypothetical protein